MRFFLPIFIAIATALFVYKGNARSLPDGSSKGNSLKKLEKPFEKVRPDQLSALPEPVRKWLEWSGIAGREKVHSVYTKQTGRMKLKPEQEKWMDSEAEQYTTASPPAFLWKVKMKMGNGLFVTGKDIFQEGKADMRIKMGGLVPIAKTRGNPKADQSSLQRYLMELSGFPSAALSKHIQWKELDERTAQAVMAYNGATGSAVFHFAVHGELLKVTAMRFKDSDENAELVPCTASIRKYQTVDGIRMPSEISVAWNLEEGPFTWYEFVMQDIAFNVEKPERL